MLMRAPSPQPRRPLRFRIAAGGLPLAALAAASVGAAPLILIEQERGVFTLSRVAANGSFEEQIVPSETFGSEPFSASVDASAAIATSSGSSHAELSTQLGAEILRATGVAGGIAIGTEGQAEAPADSFFEVVFEPSASQPFRLVGSLAADAFGVLGDSYASVTLSDVASGQTLAAQQSGPGSEQPFDLSGGLVAGARYRLTAFALAQNDAHELPVGAASVANFDLVLAVPEPSPALLLGSGGTGLALLAARGRPARGRSRAP